MTGPVSERTALYNLFNTTWSGLDPAVPVITPNEKSLDQTDEWVRFTIKAGNAEVLEIGDPKRYTRTIGVVIIQVFVRPDTGDGRARELCDTIEGIFRNAEASITDGSIRFREPTSTEVGLAENEAYYQMNVTVPYYRDEVR